jgi:hypothetical protein
MRLVAVIGFAMAACASATVPPTAPARYVPDPDKVEAVDETRARLRDQLTPGAQLVVYVDPGGTDAELTALLRDAIADDPRFTLARQDTNDRSCTIPDANGNWGSRPPSTTSYFVTPVPAIVLRVLGSHIEARGAPTSAWEPESGPLLWTVGVVLHVIPGYARR